MYAFRIWAKQGCVYRLASFLHQLEANNKQFQNIVVRCMFMYFHIIFKERSCRVRMRMQHDPRQLELPSTYVQYTPAQAEVLCAALASQYCSVTIQHESRHRLFLTAVIAKYFLMFHEKHLSQICSYYTVQYPEAKRVKSFYIYISCVGGIDRCINISLKSIFNFKCKDR